MRLVEQKLEKIVNENKEYIEEIIYKDIKQKS